MTRESHSAIPIVSAAWERRRSLHGPGSGVTAYRTLCPTGEGPLGLAIDRYDKTLVVQPLSGKSPLSPSDLETIGEWYVETTPVESVYLKSLPVDRSSCSDRSLDPPRLLAGVPAPERIEVIEHGMRFLVEPYGALGTGLFMDQRENRALLADLAGTGSVLNLFAYTCSFSVACARAGARTTSVDISKRALEWGRENFTRNGLDPALHEFFPNDVMGFLEGAKKRGRRFDLVIVDPPSFSRSKRGTFSIRRDAEALLAAAAGVLAPQGRLFFSCNYASWDENTLAGIVRRVFSDRRSPHRTRVAPRRLPLPPPPADFARQTSGMSALLVEFSEGDFR